MQVSVWCFYFSFGQFGFVCRWFLIIMKDIDSVLHLDNRDIGSFQDIVYTVVLLLLTSALYVNNI